jgi:drug/metabolite transporter (DMT)-like permease
MWATYSLMSQRMRRTGTAFPTAAIGAFCLVSGVLALGCHALLEPGYRVETADLLPLAALGIGPMGAAFFLWDAALKDGDPRAIGTLAYLTPVLSTSLLALDDPKRFGWPIVVALILVTGGAVIGTRGSRRSGEIAPQVVPVGARDADGGE